MLDKVTIYDLKSYKDERGELISLYRFSGILDEEIYVEDRLSRSNYGVIRGFHGDNKTAKLCFCIHGSFKLVTWDIKNQIKQEILCNSRKPQAIYIPPNFLNAHQCLSHQCILLYKWSHYYNGPEKQWSVRYNDPTINANWENIVPILSERDINSKYLKEIKFNVN